MAIKKQSILTKEDFEAAIVELRLSVSEVSRESGLPRHIISHFRNYGDGLKPEQTAKLRDYFESKGVEFTAEEDPAPAIRSATTSAPQRLDVMQAVRYLIRVGDNISDEVLENAQCLLEDNDNKIGELLRIKAEHEDGIFGPGEFTDQTIEVLQEAFTLMAANYIFLRMVSGWRALNVKPTTEAPETVRDVVFSTFKQSLIDAGLIGPEGNEEDTETDDQDVEEVTE